MRGNLRRWLSALVAAIATAGLLGAATPAHAADSATFQGIITDAKTGQPVAGACVALFQTPWGTPDSEACTDADGRYQITDAVPGYRYRVRVRAEGYANRWAPYGVDFTTAFSYLGALTPVTVDVTLASDAGTLRGRITRQDGSPAAQASVLVYWESLPVTLRAWTRNDGEYRLDGVPEGDYQILVQGDGYTSQWVPSASSRETAGKYHVSAGTETVVNEQFRAVSPMPIARRGTLTGTVLASATGAPAAGACVTVYDVSWTLSAVTCTDDTGQYRVSLNPVFNRYRVLVRHPDHPDVWAPSWPTPANAPLYPLVTSGTTDADVMIGDPALGATIRGRITDYPGTVPTERVNLQATTAEGSWSTTTTLRADGTYEFPRLPAGDYRVSATAYRLVREPSTTLPIVQWFPQRRTAAEADIISVGGGQVLDRDETLLSPAVLNITLVDDRTGAPVTDACVAVSWGEECGSRDGTYRFPRLWDNGQTTAVIRPKPLHFDERIEGIPVVWGKTTDRTVRLKPGAVLKATVVDRADGTTLVNACVHPVSTAYAARLPYSPADGQYRHCTDSKGDLLIGPLPATTVQLLVAPAAPYGVQWLGASGGTGDRRLAQQFVTKVGEVTTIPTIKVDRAGSITGFIKDRSTGATIHGCVEPFGTHPDLAHLRYSVPFAVCAGTDKRYTLSGLGPYQWPLRFSGYDINRGYAAAWSGGATNRFGATGVQVTAGGGTNYDLALGPEARIPIEGTNGGQTPYWTATAYDSVTGDIVNSTAYHRPYLGELNTGGVLIEYDLTPTTDNCWYRKVVFSGPLRRVSTQTVVNVVAGQTTAPITLPAPGTCQPAPPPLAGSATGQLAGARPALSGVTTFRTPVTRSGY